MRKQFSFFVINGGILGLIAWFVQLGIFHFIGENSHIAYGVATVVVYPVLVVINFFMQRSFIFEKKGCFRNFVIINFSVMVLMAIFAPWFRWVIALWLGDSWGDMLGFAIAALAMAPLSFFAMRHWVFKI